ncbi:hypothetical protein [Agilicoccus flavus]|uniref:hypothetical protein n=1 Tax=Agilicoccus flavus TaxID=2775968 RepID=UPI001CF64325|nr:hypothetical protein [Agilicoccus flavus]
MPVALRDRVDHSARERGVTAAALIEALLDGDERRRRMDSFGRAVRGADQAYRDEFHQWDIAADRDD